MNWSIFAGDEKDLLLPCDTSFINSFALLPQRNQKTRFAAARHQCANWDILDRLRVVLLAFQAIAEVRSNPATTLQKIYERAWIGFREV